MKRTIAFFFTVFLLLGTMGSLSACQPVPQEKTSIKVGISVYNKADTFVGELTSRLIEKARLLEQSEQVTITLLQESAEGSQIIQNNQVEGFIEAGCDIICVNLVDRTDAALIIDMAVAANTPILFFNRELVEEDLERSDLLYYVGSATQQSGKMQGELVAALYKKDATAIDKNGDGILQYVMLEGEAGHQDAIVRTESSVQTVLAAGIRLERLEDEIANWVRTQAETKMMRWLQTHNSSIELVFANNDDMALGAIDALSNAGIPATQWPVVVGIDGTQVGLTAVQDGQMAGTVYNDAVGQAQGLLDLIFALELGGEMPALADGKYLRLPYQTITSANVEQYF